MSILIRDVREHELDSVLALNNAAGPGILPMDAAKLRFFWENADYFRVAEKDGLLAGFLIALSQEAAHDSPNFLWFRERYPRFAYVDRIAVAAHARRREEAGLHTLICIAEGARAEGEGLTVRERIAALVAAFVVLELLLSRLLYRLHIRRQPY